MHYTCALQGLEFTAHHGLYPEERLIGGRFIVDLTVQLETDDNNPLNELKQVANYELLHTVVKQHMATPEHLIETVAKKILDDTHAHFPQALWVEVRITKPNPAGLFKSGNAVVALRR